MLTLHRGGPRWGRRWKWTKEVHIYTHIYLHVCEYIHAQTAHTGSLIKQNILFCHLFVMVCVCALMIRLPLHRLTPCFSFYHAYCTCQETGKLPIPRQNTFTRVVTPTDITAQVITWRWTMISTFNGIKTVLMGRSIIDYRSNSTSNIVTENKSLVGTFLGVQERREMVEKGQSNTLRQNGYWWALRLSNNSSTPSTFPWISIDFFFFPTTPRVPLILRLDFSIPAQHSRTDATYWNI